MIRLEQRREAREMAGTPGRFEGEGPITVLLWEISVDGGCDDEYGHENLGWWGRIGRYIVHQSDYGFITSARYASAEEAARVMVDLMLELDGEDESENY